ncbi:hypothetical protein PLICRDRAFT_647730 [Plicaturopsis crispa FD-325 SS-3]|nr:hypothetical protein PLICRDRAFT_647730 [Plicaturopsis crispa FD-325 SS-3]
MQHAWVGPMPVKEFLEAFLPAPPEPRPYTSDDVWFKMWDNVQPGKGANPQIGMYAQLIDAIDKSKICPDLRFFDTHSRADRSTNKGHKVKPDLCAYNGRDVGSVRTDNPTHWAFMEMWWEVQAKRVVADPWNDPHKPTTTATKGRAPSARGRASSARGRAPSTRGRASSARGRASSARGRAPSTTGNICQGTSTRTGFIPTAKKRVEARGQHISYNAEIFNQQHRNFAFSVTIMGDFARLVRWDRAGGIVSEEFNYKKSQYLGEFMWRFNHMSPADRGLDTTVTQASDAEIALAKRYLKDFSSKSCPLRVAFDSDQGKCHYIVWKPLGDPLSSIGRATRGYPAFHLEQALAKPDDVELVFMKDVWRVDDGFTPQEGIILKELNEAKVRYVPDLLSHADVDPLKYGKTKTNDKTFTKASWAPRNTSGLIPRVHYRMIMTFCGVRIFDFKESSDLMIATHHAYQAHRDAFEKCEFIHRDVSANNVLVKWNEEGKPRGTLIDWEFARKTYDIQNSHRRFTRTGTWQFMSCRLLEDPDKRHEIQDDIESFVHIVMYIGLRWIPHNRVDHLYSIFKHVYDASQELKGGKMTGGAGKEQMFYKNRYIGNNFAFDLKDGRVHPMTTWVREAVKVMKRWIQYANARDARPPTPEVESEEEEEAELKALNEQYKLEDDLVPKKNPLPDHSFLDHVWEIVLKKVTQQKWPTNDRVDDQLPRARELHHTEVPVVGDQSQLPSIQEEHEQQEPELGEQDDEAMEGYDDDEYDESDEYDDDDDESYDDSDDESDS